MERSASSSSTTTTTSARGLQALLAARRDLEVVGVGDQRGDGGAMALDLQPDVVLMDLHMPRLNGIEATERIVRVLAAHRRAGADDDGGRGVGLRGGTGGRAGLPAQGRPASRDRPLHRGGGGRRGHLRPRHRRAGHDLLQGVRSSRPPELFPQLTDREREVLARIAAGRENAEIARELGVSTKTVRNHASNIFAKLQVAHRAQAIVLAREAGLE